jgi:hypothetical protein
MDPIYEHDIRAAVDCLPVSALPMAAAMLQTLPADAASATERDWIADLLRARGPTEPTPASLALLAAWGAATVPGATTWCAQGSAGWLKVLMLYARSDADAALGFYEVMVKANAARSGRASDCAWEQVKAALRNS